LTLTKGNNEYAIVEKYCVVNKEIIYGILTEL
jgi:hypothetical protein